MREKIDARNRITQAIKVIVAQYLENKSEITDPYDINCGYCEDFGIEVLQLAGFDPYCVQPQLANLVWIEDLKDTPDPDASHAVIMLEWFDGQHMYFDSECPEGVVDAAKIPAVVNKNKTKEQVISERITTSV